MTLRGQSLFWPRRLLCNKTAILSVFYFNNTHPVCPSTQSFSGQHSVSTENQHILGQKNLLQYPQSGPIWLLEHRFERFGHASEGRFMVSTRVDLVIFVKNLEGRHPQRQDGWLRILQSVIFLPTFNSNIIQTIGR